MSIFDTFDINIFSMFNQFAPKNVCKVQVSRISVVGLSYLAKFSSSVAVSC